MSSPQVWVYFVIDSQSFAVLGFSIPMSIVEHTLTRMRRSINPFYPGTRQACLFVCSTVG